MSNLFEQFKKQALIEDGTWSIFFMHKLVHICAGAAGALAGLYVYHSLAFGICFAFTLGIIRELTKTTPMLLHVITVLITGSGSFIGWLLFYDAPVVQIVSTCVMAIYSGIITYLQLKS